jgi:uncharacterized protein
MTKFVRDPVYGEISIPDEFLPIVDHPLFQRLRGIKQLGVAYLVYPGATHSRFSHSLGAFHIAKSFKDPRVMLYALVHDVGHAPLSHVVESALKKAHVSFDHDEHLKDYMKQLLEGTSFELKDLRRVRRKAALVDGDLGVDRMDYLIRDSYYTGVTAGQIPWERLVRLMKVKGGKTIIHPKSVGSVEHFFIARYIMGSTVYMHKTVLIAQGMFSGALKHLLKDVPHEEIVRMDDAALSVALRSHEKAGVLWNKIESRDIFKMIKRYDSEKQAREDYKKLAAELGEDAVIQGRRGKWYKPIRVSLETGERLQRVSPLVSSLMHSDRKRGYHFVAVDRAHMRKVNRILKS